MFCNKCGKEIGDDSKFCNNCGYKFEIPKNIDEKSRRGICLDMRLLWKGI